MMLVLDEPTAGLDHPQGRMTSLGQIGAPGTGDGRLIDLCFRQR
ncbi:MAG: hypothetical protein ACLSH1_04115 [Clostridia bacterium]